MNRDSNTDRITKAYRIVCMSLLCHSKLAISENVAEVFDSVSVHSSDATFKDSSNKNLWQSNPPFFLFHNTVYFSCNDRLVGLVVRRPP